MSRGAKIAAGLVVALLGVVALVALFTSSGSPRKHIASTYQQVADTDLNDRDSRTYTSPERPGTVANDIAAKWKPAQRLNDPAGYFLRYSDTFVAVTAGPNGQGSTIYVDDEDRGYNRWYGYVGGYWGTYSGGGGFRGGGPGAGK